MFDTPRSSQNNDWDLPDKAASHTRKHMVEDVDYVFYVHKQEADILRVKLQSRHTSSKQYQLWIQYEKNGFDPIKDWYCQCKTRARTVGCCEHIASVLWHLEYMENRLSTTVMLIQNMKWMQLFSPKQINRKMTHKT